MKQKVNLIAPSSKVSKIDLNRAVKNLKENGFEAVYSKNILFKEGYFAGTKERRIEELTQSLISQEKLIFCCHGGYGSIGLLDDLPWKKILKTKKIIQGSSDITAILLGLHKKKYKGTLVHGVMPGSKNWDEKESDFKSLKKIWAEKNYFVKLNNIKSKNIKSFEGKIIGGNLRIITHMIGTKYEPCFNNKVLFLEDVNERAPAIYVMLLHLYMVGKLDKLKGLIVGKMINCGKYLDFLEQFLPRLKCPIIYEVPLGHCKDMIPIRLDDFVVFNSKVKKLFFYKN